MKIIDVYENHKGEATILHKVMIDDEDYDKVKMFDWFWRDGYAVRKHGRNSYYQLHRFLGGAEFKEQVLIDHKNGIHEDCQKGNLRRADRFQNQQNRKTNKDNELPKGIRMLPSGKYNVRLQGWNKREVFGAYETVEEATEARNKRAQELHGEFYRASHLI